MTLKSKIEGLLFHRGSEGINIEKDCDLLEAPVEEVETTLIEMMNEFENNDEHGIVIKKFNHIYKMLIKQNVSVKLFNIDQIKVVNPLNNSLMETLAIIAYNSPCTRTKIHEIRKIDPTMQLEKLIELGFIRNLGRSSSQGKPFIYEVTEMFYDKFGISSLNELPEIKLPEKFEDNETDFFDSNRDEAEY